MFMDTARILVKAGDGGAGLMAFRREKYVPFGGPAGGDGGKGGNVVLRVNPHLNTLTNFRHRREFKADRGKSGGNFNRTGASADDMVIEVPPGTIVRDDATSNLIADLTHPGQEVIVAHGGRGGRGNARFKTSTNQAPRMAEKGEPGEERWVQLELKLIADVGIVGLPNAGKSTLLSVVSGARPKIADYAFTTLEPNLGVAYVDDREMVVADIPGLVEGAHLGVGLGHAFLRHVQRTRLLIHMLDGTSSDPVGDYVQINTELSLFDPALGEKPQLIAFNKIDQEEARARMPAVRKALARRGAQFFAISALTRDGVTELMNKALETLSAMPPVEQVEEVPLYAPEDEDEFQIAREGAAYRVTGKRIERAAAMTYWEYDEAVERFQRVLYSLGIADALREAGATKGDTVLIGEYELEWAE